MTPLASARRYGPAALAVVMLALGLLALLNTARSIGAPFAGVLILRNHFQGYWQVDPATPSWWPALAQSTLQYDDIVVDLDGMPYGPAAESQFASAARDGRASMRMGLQRQGARVEIGLPIARFTFANFVDSALPEFINGLCLWFLAVAVFRARPEDVVNRAFAATFALVAGVVWAPQPGLFVDTGGATRALQLTWVIAFCCVAPPFLHLTLLIPEPARRMPHRLLTGAWVYAALLTTAYVSATVLCWRDPSSALAHELCAFSSRAQHVFGWTMGLFCTVRLGWFMGRRDLSRRLRRQVHVLAVGLALCLPYMVIQLLRSLGTHGFFWSGLDLRCTLLPLPISMAFLILRYQTFRRAHPVIGGVLVLGTSALLASVGAWVLRMTDPAGLSSLAVPPFLPLFCVALFASFVWSTETSWSNSIARLFEWNRRSYAAARQFGQEVVGQGDLRDTPAAIVTALVGKMELERVALWLWDERQHVFTLAAHAGSWSRRPTFALPTGPLVSQEPPIRLQAGTSPVPQWLIPLREHDGIEVAATLWASGRPVGLLGLGKRWDDEIFDQRDLEIVELIAQQTALFILTAAQIHQLRQVPHQIAQTQERERFKIAQELHDTVQQFLGRLPFYLEVSREVAREDPAETENILKRCLTDVEAAAQTVREIRANLAPLQLERSLAEPLRRLVTHFTTRSGIASEVLIAEQIDSRLDLEARHALYRVVQQALDNVSAHAEARRVRVTVEQDRSRVNFVVADDGRGFLDEQRVRAAERGSFGLTSMRARVTSLGGEFAIESTPNAGTRVSGWLPIDADAAPSS